MRNQDKKNETFIILSYLFRNTINLITISAESATLDQRFLRHLNYNWRHTTITFALLPQTISLMTSKFYGNVCDGQ